MALSNVLAVLPGKKTDEYVVVGAHLDHEGVYNDLAGDKIYNGADDNASGVAAVLQIMKAFVASGVQPERTVVFAFGTVRSLDCSVRNTSPTISQKCRR